MIKFSLIPGYKGYEKFNCWRLRRCRMRFCRKGLQVEVAHLYPCITTTFSIQWAAVVIVWRGHRSSPWCTSDSRKWWHQWWPDGSFLRDRKMFLCLVVRLLFYLFVVVLSSSNTLFTYFRYVGRSTSGTNNKVRWPSEQIPVFKPFTLWYPADHCHHPVYQRPWDWNRLVLHRNRKGRLFRDKCFRLWIPGGRSTKRS